MKQLTNSELLSDQKAKHCYICNEEFTENSQKVSDHCHFTGKYRGPAHQFKM